MQKLLLVYSKKDTESLVNTFLATKINYSQNVVIDVLVITYLHYSNNTLANMINKLYIAQKYGDTLLFTTDSNKCLNNTYDTIIFFDKISNYDIYFYLKNHINHSVSYQIWNESDINTENYNIPYRYKTNKQISKLSKYNVFINLNNFNENKIEAQNILLWDNFNV